MRIRDFENCVSMAMPNFSFGFLIHRAFHSVAIAPETQAKASPSAVEKQLCSVEQLRQALQIMTVASRVAAVFGLLKRLALYALYSLKLAFFSISTSLSPHCYVRHARSDRSRPTAWMARAFALACACCRTCPLMSTLSNFGCSFCPKTSVFLARMHSATQIFSPRFAIGVFNLSGWGI